MVDFVFFLQATQYRNGGLHGGLAHHDFLKPPLQGRIFFNELAVLVKRRGSHTMELSAGERWLEHIASIHGPLGLASAHHGVELIDEHNRLPLILGQLTEHGL